MDGLFNKVKDAASGAKDALVDLGFGGKTTPPLPTTDQQARDLIDASIGRQPDDAKIVDDLRAMQLTSRLISAVDTASGGLLSMGPYSPEARARWATGQIQTVPDPYTIADKDLQDYFQRNPRSALLYAREFDPQNKQLMPYLVETQATRSGGLFSAIKNVVSDLPGNPIGGALELLGKPAKWAEIQYGTRFVWNDIGDASLRRTMAKYSYEARFNPMDWGNNWEARARLKSEDIQNSGLRGDAAAAEFEKWVNSDGNPGISAAITDMVGQMIFDPLWMIPADTVLAGAGKGIRALTPLEEGAPLGRLARFAPAFSTRSRFGFDTFKELLNADELTYRTAQIASPALRGSGMWLVEQTPARFADSATRETSMLLSGPLMRAPTLESKLGVLAAYNDMMKTGRVGPQAAELFGPDVFKNSTLAKFQARLGQMKGRQAVEDVLEGLAKPGNELLTQLPSRELNEVLLAHMHNQTATIAREGQEAVWDTSKFGRLMRRRWLPLVAWQKTSMALFTLSRPGFVALNLGNNLFTYMWGAAGQPTDALDMWRHSMGAEFSGKLGGTFQKLADAHGLDVADIERTVTGNVTRRELFGQNIGGGFNLTDENLDVKKVIEMAKQSVARPVKELSPFKFSNLLAWPVLAASRLDRATRRATFYNSLREQINLYTAPRRLIDGLMPDLKTALIGAGLDAPTAERWEGHMISSVRDYIHGGNSLMDKPALRAAWLKSAQELIDSSPRANVSAYDYAMRFARDKLGMPEQGAVHWIRDADPTLQKIHTLFGGLGDPPDVQRLRAGLDKIGYDLWTVDNVAAGASRTPSVIRPGTDYGKQLSLTEEGIRADMLDGVYQISRLADTVFPDFTGSAQARRRIFSAADDMIQGRLNRLAAINSKKMSALAAGAGNTAEWKKEEQALWAEYNQFTRDSQLAFFNAAREELGAVNENVLKPIEDWYATLIKTQDEHQKILQKAMELDTPEAWQRAGEKVSNLYQQAALKRADIFGWAPNDPASNMGHVRPTAPLVRQMDEMLQYIKDNVGPDLAKAMQGGPGITGTATAADALRAAANEFAGRAPGVARQGVANARAKTDFVMLDYNNQLGLDSAFQMLFPYEFFPTRTAFNWAIRVARSPGAGAALAKAILLPADYATRYGMPSRLKYKIPIPIPFLQDWLGNVPVLGDKISNADFGSVYWVDPLSYMFPLTGFRSQFNDEQKTGVGLGGIANYFQQNTPLGISPYVKIIGGFTGALDRDAWTNSLFAGGPYGIPMTAYGAAAGKWLFTGDGSDVPASEKDNFTSFGSFSKDFLANIFGMNGTRFDDYRRERALSSLVAEGKVTPDDAWEAMFAHKGAAWQQAVKAANSEKFLADFTGWAGFRVTGSLRGEQIRLGEKALYSKAAAEGRLKEFYQKFPEYEIYNVAVKGVNDPKGRQAALETTLYYRDIERIVNAPYQKTLDELDLRIQAIRNKDNLTETDMEQITYLNDNIQAIREQQDAARAQIDLAYPNRNQAPSVFMPPKEFALSQVANQWYAFKQGQGTGVPLDETYAEFQARRDSWLRQLPAKTADMSEQDWTDLGVEYQQTLSKYNLLINKAYNAGDFSKGQTLQDERDAVLSGLQEDATQRVTRYDVEQWLAQFQRRATPAEVEFNDASATFDLWMSLVGTGSPLTTRQQAAVSAYFRSLPLLQKHYNASVIDLRTLNGSQLAALARRREIRTAYANLRTNDAKIDYMRSVSAEYNAAQAILGLPPIAIIDARPAPPSISAVPYETAAADFTGGRDLLDLAASDPTGINSDQPMSMSPADIQRYVDAAIARGY